MVQIDMAPLGPASGLGPAGALRSPNRLRANCPKKTAAHGRAAGRREQLPANAAEVKCRPEAARDGHRRALDQFTIDLTQRAREAKIDRCSAATPKSARSSTS
jgi:ATP-dependent Clp protease ATP-binding subunit ClpA